MVRPLDCPTVAEIDASEYTDEEETVDVLVAAAAVLQQALDRPQPAYLLRELRSVLSRVLEQIKMEEEWLH